MPERSIQEVQEDYTPGWMELPGVVGTGVGECDGEPCIRIFLSDRFPGTAEALPDSVEGCRVETQVTGPVRPRPPEGRPLQDTSQPPDGADGLTAGAT